MKKKEIARFLVFRTFGNFFILLTIFGFLATFGPAIYFEGRYRVAQASGIEFNFVENKNQISELGKLVDKQNGTGKIEEGAGQESLFGSIISGDKEQVLSVKDTDFSIVIPKIGASEKVIANVDPGSEKEYKKSLLEGVAHAKGSSLPGLNGTTYIFAHSADSFWNVGRYNAVFYLLKELKPGDEIIIVFQGKRFNYKVTETKIVDPSEVTYLEAKIGQGEQLILQTCWPPGTTFKRLLVFAKPE